MLEPFREQCFSWGSITAWGNNREICSRLSKTKTPWEIMKCIFYSIIQVKHHLFPRLCGIWTIFSFVLSWRKKCDAASYHVLYGREWVLCGGREAVTLSSHAPRCSLQGKGGIRDPCSYREPSDECCRAPGKVSKKISGKMRLLWAFPFTKPMLQGWCNSSFGGFVLLFFPCGVKIANPALVITT